LYPLPKDKQVMLKIKFTIANLLTRSFSNNLKKLVHLHVHYTLLCCSTLVKQLIFFIRNDLGANSLRMESMNEAEKIVNGSIFG